MTTRLFSMVVLLAVLAGSVPGSGAGAQRAAPLAGRGSAGIPVFSHVVVVVMENKEYGQVVGSSSAPGFAALARRYALLSDYRGVAHPSLPNYLALVSGSTQGISSDCTSCQIDAPNLADSLERAGKTWKTYAEGLPSPGFTGAESGRYAKKHDPFVYFRDVAGRAARLHLIVPLATFYADLAAKRLPSFSLVVPDLCHDMHDCAVASGDAWLTSFLKPVLASPAFAHGVVFVVFDEGTSDTGGGGHVPALALGGVVRRGSRLTVTLDHYSVLRTIEESWHLPLLGNSAGATAITGIWRSS